MNKNSSNDDNYAYQKGMVSNNNSADLLSEINNLWMRNKQILTIARVQENDPY